MLFHGLRIKNMILREISINEINTDRVKHANILGVI